MEMAEIRLDLLLFLGLVARNLRRRRRGKKRSNMKWDMEQKGHDDMKKR